MSESGINARQFAIMTLLVVIGDSLIVLPGAVITSAKQDGWIAVLLSMLVGLPFLLLFVSVYIRGPKGSLAEKILAQFGRWAGGALLLLFLIFPLIVGAGQLREIGDFLITNIIPETPGVAVVSIFMIVVGWAIKGGLGAFARAGEVLFLCFVLVFLFFVLSIVPQVELSNLLPVFEKGPGPISHGSFISLGFCYIELMPMMMLMPYVHARSSGELRRSFLIGAMAGGIILFIVTFLCITVLGPALAARQMYPTFTLSKKISVGDFMERLEAMLAFMWIISTFMKATVNLFALQIGFNQLIGGKDYRSLTVPMAVLAMAAAAFITPNISQFNSFISLAWPFYDLTVVIFPLLLLIVYAVKREGKRF